MKVYILYSRSLDKYYVGQTKNIEQRIERHNQGKVSSTKRGVPWEVVYDIVLKDRSEAVFLEKKIKGRGEKRYLEDIGI